MFSTKERNKLKRILETQPNPTPPDCPPGKRSRSEELALKSRQRLSSARFRQINEFLYSHSSAEANHYLSSHLFNHYHNTYEEIMKKWPQRPIDHLIQRLKKRSTKGLTIADIGCGSRPLIKEAFPSVHVHSFDLVSQHKDITAANMTLLPLDNQSIDICVYSLSLMATDVTQCLLEANRVLRANGTLLVAEVLSRFDPSETEFARQLKTLGFSLTDSERVNDYFIVLEFVKSGDPKRRTLALSLKPCKYKSR